MADKSRASHQSMASGKTAPTLTPIGHYEGKPEVPLSRSVTLIGSGPGARLQLFSSTVSKSHAIIVNCDRGCYIRDLASRMKVLVNEQPVREAVLVDGDTLQIGKFTFRYNPPPGITRSIADEPIPDAPAAAAVEVTGVEGPILLSERCLLIGRRETTDVYISDE